MHQSIVFIISSPSGVGKSSLIREIFKIQPLLKISISHTTRKIRPGEKDGLHYYFTSKKKFKDMIRKNMFIEYAKIFGNYYGTSQNTIKKILSQKKDIILDIDWQGAQKIRKKIPYTCSIFLLPPSKEELYSRLKNRKQDSTIVIKERMKSFNKEISHYSEYDYLIVNDNFYKALLDLKSIICSEHLRIQKQKIQEYFLIKKLLSNTNCLIN